jgi:hypothetical protein
MNRRWTTPHDGRNGRLLSTARYNPPEMSILKVARMGHPVLRAKAQALERAEIRKPPVQRLIDDMIETMIEYHGVGLAAPQVHEGRPDLRRGAEYAR